MTDLEAENVRLKQLLFESVICRDSRLPNGVYIGSKILNLDSFDFLNASVDDIEKFLDVHQKACYNLIVENEMLLNPAP